MSINSCSHQGKGNYSGSERIRNPDDIQMTGRAMDSSNQNTSNLLLSGPQTSVTSSILNYQSASFGGLYSSPGFNSSLASYENNLQWLSDNRIQNQHTQMMPDKSIPTSTHSLPPTSHSCCVNRFGMLDSLGMASPVPHDQVKAACDASNFQNKSAITMNMIDPIQSWLNLPIPSQIQASNQQYCKYGERSVPATQNYNIPTSTASQICLPVLGLDQADLKQNDMCIQSPDVCFENMNSVNSKQVESSMKPNTFVTENKQGTIQENTFISKQSTYQSSMMAKDWKAPFQNYISSPNVFSAINESQDNFVFAQYSMQPTNSYYSAPDNSYTSFVNKNNTCTPQTKTSYTRSDNIPSLQNSFASQSQIKVNTTSQNFTESLNTVNSFYPSKNLIKEAGKLQSTHKHHSHRSAGNYDSLNDCCQMNKPQGSELNPSLNNCFPSVVNNQDNNTNTAKKSSLPLEPSNQTDKRGFKNSETVSSESDESNIIVEESDEIGEIESEISIEEIKKTYESSGNEVLLRCLICNVATSSQTPANQFIHMNESFPLTSSSKIPIKTKLNQILRVEFQHYLKKNNCFMCRRCLNLVETVEVLEVKLSTAKQTLNDNFSKTVQHLMPDLENMIDNEVSDQDVDQLLQNDSISKSLSMEENTKTTKPFEFGQESMENECPNDEEALSISDSEPAEFQCSYCFKLLSSQKYLNFHLQQHTKDFSYYCERCGKGFPLKNTLQKHLNWHNSEGRNADILCEICGEMFVTNHMFKSHLLKIHSQEYIYKCKTCGKGFTRKISLEIHSHKHTGARMFICEYCGHTFTSESNLRNHIKLCNKDFQYSCEDCGKSFVSESQLAKHESKHTGIYKLSCSVCSKGFHKPSDLNFHMLSHSTDKQFKCKECKKSFKTQGNLNYHVKTVHKEETIFKCNICAQNFFQERLLSDHVKSHSNEKPYKCKQCEKSFVHQSTFITHLKVHEGKVKLKTCEVCGKSIKMRMSVHMRTHTGERPYRCTYCPMAFTVGISLKKHISAKHVKNDIL